MATRGPTLINRMSASYLQRLLSADLTLVPPPPSDPATPSELGPGTPNSTTTSLSALSVVAIKDGTVGHGTRGGTTSAGTLEAERADRISRLAGLERVGTVRAPNQNQLAPGASAPPGYFDNAAPQFRERSTVGSASATGSVGGRTTWASESVDYDADKMSEDQDDGMSSNGGFSDEGNASLVGFGEGAGSTVSGPVSSAAQRAMAARQGMSGSPTTPRSGNTPTYLSGTTTVGSGAGATGGVGSTDPKMMDGITYDADIVDTTMQPAPLLDRQQQQRVTWSQGTEVAESIMRDRIMDVDSGHRAMGTPDSASLGKFPFERD